MTPERERAWRLGGWNGIHWKAPRAQSAGRGSPTLSMNLCPPNLQITEHERGWPAEVSIIPFQPQPQDEPLRWMARRCKLCSTRGVRSRLSNPPCSDLGQSRRRLSPSPVSTGIQGTSLTAQFISLQNPGPGRWRSASSRSSLFHCCWEETGRGLTNY